MISFPKSIAQAVTLRGEIQAGATDLFERRRLGLARGPVVDLRDVADLATIAWDGDSLRIGAMVTIAALARDPEVQARLPALAAAAGGLATPQIRESGTVGGNLLQRVRCWYFRSPGARCLKAGGDTCQARGGDHLYHSCFDLGPCVAPHPSTLGVALLAYDATVEVAGAAGRSIAALFGEAGDPTREHTLEAGALLTAVRVPAPPADERGAYFRAISRARAEWPLCEVAARIRVRGGVIDGAEVAIGGVANRPLRLPRVESALRGRAAAPAVLAEAAALAAEGARPLPMTAYKVELIPGAVLEALERALA